MIDRSLLRPFTRHKAETLTIACRLVLGSRLYINIVDRFSINGACNVRMAKMILNAIAPIAHDRCNLTGLHNIVRLDPLFSLEFLLHPSNLRSNLFSYASRCSPSVFVQSVSHVLVEYGSLCHILGSSICLSLTDIKEMCLLESIDGANCDFIIFLMQNWLSNILIRSRPYLEIQLDDVINYNIEVEVVLAFLFVIRSTRYIYDEITDLEEVKRIDNVVYKLWKLLFSRSTEYGGPVFCLFKLASAMSIIKSALLFSAVINGETGTNYEEIVLENVLVCFRFTCNGCKHCPGAVPYGKQIIVGSSSNDAICDAINSIVTGSSSPLKASFSLLSCMQSTDWLDKFVWCDVPTVNIVESLRRDLILPCEMIEKCCAPRLTSLAVKAIPNISSNDIPSLMAIMDNGFGACCAQRYEDGAVSKICFKELFITAMKCYELFFEAQMKSTRRDKWDRWMECVVTEFPHRGLSQDDMCCFIVFIADLCIFPIHRKCMIDISCKAMKTVNNLWCSDMSKYRVSCMANAVVSLCECALFLDCAKSEVLKSWLKDNIYIGSNSMKRPRNSIVPGFEDCYRDVGFLLPHEM